MKMLSKKEALRLVGYDNGDVFTCTIDEMISDYYSVYLCTGMNKPKISKQLRKLGIPVIQEELQAVGECIKYLENMHFIALADPPEFFGQNEWALDGSCNRIDSPHGLNTSGLMRYLGARYCYIWDESGEPLARFYYFEHPEFGYYVSDAYTVDEHGLYLLPQFVLCALGDLGARIGDFKAVNALPICNSNGIWTNMASSRCSQFSTEYIPDVSAWEDYDGYVYVRSLDEYCRAGFCQWSDYLDDYLLENEAVWSSYADDWLLEADTVYSHYENDWLLEDTVEWSERLDSYINAETAVYSHAVQGYLPEYEAVWSEEFEDWLPSDYED